PLRIRLCPHLPGLFQPYEWCAGTTDHLRTMEPGLDDRGQVCDVFRGHGLVARWSSVKDQCILFDPYHPVEEIPAKCGQQDEKDDDIGDRAGLRIGPRAEDEDL